MASTKLGMITTSLCLLFGFAPALSQQEAEGESWDAAVRAVLAGAPTAPVAAPLTTPSHLSTPKLKPAMPTMEPISMDPERKKVTHTTYLFSLPRPKPVQVVVTPRSKPLVMIDPGHGGEDPGAIGANGLYEKEVTLTFARQIKSLLEKTGKYRVALTRKDDRFVSLSERLTQARRQESDLFISLHADSHADSKMHGLSVYTLSKTASDKEAEKLASRENEADRVKGVTLGNEHPEVASILIDLTKRETMNRSKLFAKVIIERLSGKRYRSLIPNAHRSAAFAVLKAQDIPSVLVELGYLSNQADLTLLASKKSRQQLSADIAQAIETYFSLLP